MLIGTAVGPRDAPPHAAPTPSSCASDARAPLYCTDQNNNNKENDPTQLRRSVSTAAQLQGAAAVLMGGMPLASPPRATVGRTESAPTAVLEAAVTVRPYTGLSDEEVDDELFDEGATTMSSSGVDYHWAEELTASVVAHKGTPLAERLKGLLDSEPSSPVRALGFE